MTIAFFGGLAGLVAAWVLRAGLLRLVSESVELPFAPDVRLLGFAFLLTLAAGLLLGLLPALRTLSLDSSTGWQAQGRGLTGSTAWLRAGKTVVAGQLALSLPLLIGACLLVRTFYNLQRVDLGYAKEQLLTVNIDAQTAGYQEARQFPLFQQLLDKVQGVPGVRVATYANNGLFSGSDSRDSVLVEGYTPTGSADRRSRYEHVGPHYFSTLGVPLLMGREITDRDQPAGTKVCVINEAFAKQFFAGRNPIGLHVTQVYGNQRHTFEVVGVARDSRANGLRGAVEHRYYVPVAQPVFSQDAIVLIIRTVAEPSSVIAGVRRAILSLDPNLPITEARPLAEAVNQRMAQDRLLARLSSAFGLIALVLAAIGLYGVLSYGVARRTSEIGIRKALGAPHSAVMAMILRETGLLLVVGIIAGFALSIAGIRLIASRLYGTTPLDPLAMGGAVIVLSVVALAATWIPAYRASRIDPLIALRYE